MAEPFDLDLELLPADGGELSADAELDAVLGHVPPDETDETPLPYGRGWQFDFATGQFVRAGARPIIVRGFDNLRVWIEKTLRTARFAHPIYDAQYGTERPFDLIGQQPTPDLISRLEQAITEALVVHDRISAISDFKYDLGPDDDALFVGFTVTTDEGTQLGVDRIVIT